MADFAFTVRDGPEVCDYYWEGTVLHRVHRSENEDATLEENRRVLNDGGARTLSFGRMFMQVPYATWLMLRKINPALASKDNVERTRAWMKLAQDGGYRDLTVSKP